MITFATFTVVLVLMLSYTVYVYFGVCKATRMIVCDMNFTVSEDDVSIKTTLTVRNPSEFDFLVVYVNEKFYLGGKVVGEHDGYWTRSHGNSLELHSFSSLNITVTAGNVPISKEQIKNLYVFISIAIETPLPKRSTLRFTETLHEGV